MNSSITELLERDQASPMDMEARVEISLKLAYMAYGEGETAESLTEDISITKLPMFCRYLVNDPDNMSNEEKDRMLSFMIFKTIFHEDPFMGRETLYRYPLLTEKNKIQIYKDNPMYVFHPEHINDYPALSEYETQISVMQFLPGYLTKAFERAFVDGINNSDAGPTAEEWITICRRLRDDLMNSDRLPFFICWDKDGGYSPKINYFEISKTLDSGDEPLWVMPIKSGKNIYPYHVSFMPDKDMNSDGEPIAGFDDEGNLRQMDRGSWILVDTNNPEGPRFIKNEDNIHLESHYKLILRADNEGERKTFIFGNQKSGAEVVDRWRNR